MSTMASVEFGTEILIRTIDPTSGGMSTEAAKAVLDFRLAPLDRDRVNALAQKAREGSLTNVEEAQLREYERVAALLEVMQSKARISLRQAGLSQ